MSSDEERDDSSTSLYSEVQTELYVPPPVENGKVPTNNFGNIDIFVSSMVPAGGVHIVRPNIALAAKFAGIDYADAVTGFDFVKNRANPRLNGIVVAQENTDGLLEIWEGMMERVEREEERIRVKTVLDRWRRFFIGLGIRRRLDDTHGKVDDPESMIEENGNEDLDGGFLRGAFQDGGEFETRPYDDFEGATRWLFQSEPGPRQPAFPLEPEHMPSTTNAQIMMALDGPKEGGPSAKIEHQMVEDKGEMQDEEPQDRTNVEDDDSDGGGFIYEDEDGIL